MSMRFLAAVLAVFLGVACDDDVSSGTDAAHDHSADGGTKLDFARFDKALQDAIDAHNNTSDAKIKGASAVVVHEKLGTVHTQAFGEFAEDRLYLIASSSKILSVGVLMRLADQGKLDVDEPVGAYLKDWGETKVSAVTVAQMVSNSSGLPSLSEVSAAGSDP